jgi:molybdopterin converting factor small subunit
LEKMVFESARQGLKPSILVLLNGVTHWNLKQGLATELKNGDEVELRPMAAGG